MLFQNNEIVDQENNCETNSTESDNDAFVARKIDRSTSAKESTLTKTIMINIGKDMQTSHTYSTMKAAKKGKQKRSAHFRYS